MFFRRTNALANDDPIQIYFSLPLSFTASTLQRPTINSEILKNKISNLPILNNDTHNVIEFNDGYSNGIKNKNPRSFWKLLKFE